MNELHLQDKFLIPFFCNDLVYKEVKANTVTNSLIIEEDLETFISQTALNEKAYESLLKKYKGNKAKLLQELIALIQERIGSSRNMALFINVNKSITLQGVKLHLFYPSDSITHGNEMFNENIFSVVQELSYKFKFQGEKIFSFRPDIVLFVNGIYLGYSELKNNYTSQNANKNGRGKVIKDYFEAVKVYHQHIDSNNMLSENEKLSQRKDFLKIFEKAIHITTTDIGETYVIRTISDYFDEILTTCREGKFDREEVEKKAQSVFKLYPLIKPDADKKDKLKELFNALYSKFMIEKEILYYNFIERDVYVKKGVKEVKNEQGFLISPRPKQKFGTDKIMAKIDELLEHEQEPDYFEKLLEKQLSGVSESKRTELLLKRRAYSNNKNVYSLLMQYAAGFGKSNIIGWSALQLKDLLRPDANGNMKYVYDKVMIVVDRLQLRSQIDSLMLNMNIDKRLVVEATNKKTFQNALASDSRIVIVNLQKFGAVKEMMGAEVLERLAKMRIAFLIDEIHRSNSGDQHEDMVSIFDELQSPFDSSKYAAITTKKNLIVGFTATPDDHTLARFGEFSGYAESEKLWRPFDSFTMKEAIEDGFILNPLKNIIPVASKMIFDLPANKLAGFTEKDYKDIPKKKIYEERERINANAHYVADLLVKDVYRQIRGTGKAMLAVYSIKSAIAYKESVTKCFNELVKLPKYEKYAEAPIHIVYSSNQDEQSAKGLNGGLSEEKVLENFALKKNGLIIVVDKLQTGFDEKKLHTLFLDKEIRGISAIQTISRVNRTAKHKNDCKIVDFSYNNVNVQNIKDAFEHFSDVVVSDFDPFGDKKVLDILLIELNKSDTYDKFFNAFMSIYKDPIKQYLPESYLDFESSLKKYIEANPKRTADTKAKAGQYFTILNRIEFVIALDAKYSDSSFLFFWRKFNTLYNMLHRSEDIKDSIAVYFDNKIGIVEVVAEETKKKKKKLTEVATGTIPGESGQYDILSIIAARNKQEEKTGFLIQEFENKICKFFEFIKKSDEGKRLIVKIKSNSTEDEISSEFAKLYRRYRALFRSKVGDYFFKEMDDLVEKLCDDFENIIREDIFDELAKANSHLFLSTNNLEEAEKVFEHFEKFTQSLGFTIDNKGKLEKGSWIKKGIEAIKRISSSEEANELYVKGKKALELASIDKVQSEVNKNNAEAAAALFVALKDIDHAAMRIGSLVLIKTNVNGQSQAITHVLSTEQVLLLESKPELLNQPSLLLESLDLSSSEAKH
ncbi:DEAD/DEAH box helicase family protein [Pseudocolwellia sp. AS88]|uniref:type I restriction enzyme subunit R domain-containing protein n=1 Tax=Pseudocolwellia sp. AS88 TaxID=3063958 RepID=UPI0026EFD46C|nr:DEAD/DEAH box helicase family protein [Pseudocolwellia sp. AS88]MDO7084493.1 DEAD/DEAH box helicase family protein [Pseudocolwellia sp. AS88]